MFLQEDTLDDLLRTVLTRILKTGRQIRPTRGAARELSGVLLELTNPRARLSPTEKKGKPFGCLGELCWYLAGSNSLRFITHYLNRYEEETDDGRTVYGAYGPRIFGTKRARTVRKPNQLREVIALLSRKPDSRRGMIQIFDAVDLLGNHKEIPCTATLQFMLRENKVHMIASMRSNDAFRGLPNDVFAFTMLQELVARSLGAEIGSYKHMVGSLHLYDDALSDARAFLDEGWQESLPMLAMPIGDPWRSVRKLLHAEKVIRIHHRIRIAALNLEPYWEELARLLQIYDCYKRKDRAGIVKIRARMFSGAFNALIDAKMRRLRGGKTFRQPKQVPLFPEQ